MKEDIFDPETYQHCLERLHQISPDTKPQWGKMDAAQMMSHCAEIQEVMNGKDLKTPFFLKPFMPWIKKAVIKGAYKKNGATHPLYKQKESKDFDTEKQRLLDSMDAFISMGPEKAASILHASFGEMTAEEKGRTIYKHLDHHLGQFGV